MKTTTSKASLFRAARERWLQQEGRSWIAIVRAERFATSLRVESLRQELDALPVPPAVDPCSLYIAGKPWKPGDAWPTYPVVNVRVDGWEPERTEVPR